MGLYIRVSSRVQQNEGTSIDYQIRKGKELSQKLGMTPMLFNEQGKTSWESNINTRPELVKLLNQVEKHGLKNVWCFNMDRLGRNSDSWWSILKILVGWKVQLYVGESMKPYDFNNPTDRLVTGILSLITTYDNELRRIRMIFGKKESLKKGRTFIGGEIPFGYMKDEQKNLTPHPTEKKYVKKMFEMYSKGKTTTDIQQMMNTSEFEPKRSKIGWNLGTIQKMLQNTIYMGEQTWNWKEKEPNGDVLIIETIKIKTPILVTKKLYKEVNDRFDKYVSSNQYSTDLESLLKGFLVCSHCNLPLNHRYKQYDYYYCVYTERTWKNRRGERKKKFTHTDDTCDMKKSLNMSQTDNNVWREFLRVFSESSFVKEGFKTKGLEPKNTEQKEVEFQLKKLQKHQTTLGKQKDTLTDSLIEVEITNINKGYSSDIVYKGIIKKFENQLEDVRKEQDKVRNSISQLKGRNKWVDWVGKMKDEVDTMKDWNMEEKREILDRFVNKIYVKYDSITSEHTLSIDFNVPIVDDKIKYKSKNKTEGYTISKGIHKLKIFHKRQKFNPSEEKIKLVQKMITLREENLSYSEMSVWLNDNNIKTLRNKTWNRGSVGRFYNYLTQNVDFYVNSDMKKKKK